MKRIKSIFLICISIMIDSCAGIPGKNVNLENYPDIRNIKKDELNIDLRFIKDTRKVFNIGVWLTKFSNNPQFIDRDFNHKVENELGRHKININKSGLPSVCTLEVTTTNDVDLDGVCGPYYITTFFTAFIVPYYCQQNYQINAKLISTKDNRILKEYELKEKVHEIWSLPMFLVAIPVKSLRSIPAPEGAKKMTEDKLAEALTRQVINDANNSSECKK